MKTVRFFTFLLLATALSFGITGCKKSPKSPTPIFSGRPGMAPNSNTPSGIESGATLPADATSRADANGNTPLGARPRDLNDYIQDRDSFRSDTVYFDFDKFNLRPSELSKVQAVASSLKGQTGDAVLVEGHCDERGTPEYNRALGDRRALSVREALINLGVNGDRIHTISYGEDKPVDPGHSETAYQKNRRGEFVLLKPKTGAGDNR